MHHNSVRFFLPTSWDFNIASMQWIVVLHLGGAHIILVSRLETSVAQHILGPEFCVTSFFAHQAKHRMHA